MALLDENSLRKLKCLSGLKRLENILRWLSSLVLLMMRACYLMIYSEKMKLHFMVDPLLNCHCNLFCY
ncbi:hypothetical protein ES332_A12G225800v1 [Gossypium tomentosum]|uniref:Uncharacterized protein n=1 Tax=Gossypium tomentosum TaxID=34277 RepID=A0A5D2MZX5_GOSTO|nr:hypothetical protein ES332_A12G225800v1 [Gossypium tomentosum]